MSVKTLKPKAIVVEEMSEREWKRFAKACGGKLIRVEARAACIEWQTDEVQLADDAWFSVAMARAIKPELFKS